MTEDREDIFILIMIKVFVLALVFAVMIIMAQRWSAESQIKNENAEETTTQIDTYSWRC